MINLMRCNSTSDDFHLLIKELDRELYERYGAMQLFFNQHNKIPEIDTVIIAYEDNLPAGCGCFKQYDAETVEMKRMYVKPEYRGRGISKQILTELEKWAAELGYMKSVLETGDRQPEAIGLYEKLGYTRIPKYGPYIGVAESVCFGKDLK